MAPLLILAAWMAAQGAPPSPAAPSMALSVERLSLPNGLDVILAPDARVPTVGVALLYRVGSRDERPEQEGFAHLFEHMMFQGSAHVGKMEHFSRLERYGADVNAFTTEDVTLYHEEVPAPQLPLALWLEADRMRSLAVTPENLANQQDTVIEEMRQRYDNQPYGKAHVELSRLAYDAWAYAHPVIGSKERLQATTIDGVRAFHAAWYVPSNATLVLAGAFEREAALGWIRAYFGDVPAGAAPGQAELAEAPLTAPRADTLVDANAKLPGLFLGWRVPSASAPERPALEVLARVLGDGKSGRLFQRLVKGDRTAVHVDASLEGRAGTDLFRVTVLHAPGTREAVQAALADELAKVARDGVTPAELARAQRQAATEFAYMLASNLQRAQLLALYAYWYGDPRRLNDELAMLQAVTVDDVKAVAARFLGPTQAATLTVEVGE